MSVGARETLNVQWRNMERIEQATRRCLKQRGPSPRSGTVEAWHRKDMRPQAI